LKLAKRFSVSVQSSTVQLEKFVVEGLNSENTDNSSILHALKQILAQENNLFALKTMGDLYTSESKNRKKLGLECDENIAFKFFLQAAEKGDANAQLKVATYYFNAYDILLKSYKDGNVNNYIDDDVFFDRNSIVMDPETGTYKYIDPKSQRRKKMVEEREKLNPPKTAYDTTGLSSKVIKVNLKENVTLGMEWLLRSANNGNSQAQLMVRTILLLTF
jgi:TPR repeat protein